jgi:hypothetical protein
MTRTVNVLLALLIAVLAVGWAAVFLSLWHHVGF